MKISCSEISTFLSCRRKWSYSGENMRNLEPLAPTRPFFLGSAVHEALEVFYRDGADPKATFDTWTSAKLAEWRESGIPYNEGDYEKDINLGRAMLQGYLDHYGASPTADADGMEVICTEQEFSVPIPTTDNGHLVGRMDGLCRDKIGRVWVLEHKTYSSQPKLLSHQFQTIAYTWAANLLSAGGVFAARDIAPGTRIYGALYNGLRKQAPGPRVTLPLFYRQWLWRRDRELELFELYLIHIHNEMANPNVALYPTYSRSCEICTFQEPCGLEALGMDYQWHLEYQYQAPRGKVYANGESYDE